MGVMILGGYTFDWDAKRNFDVISPKKLNSHLPTYGSVAYFSWGTQLIGQEIKLKWDEMPSSQFTAIDEIYQSDLETTLDLIGDAVTIYTIRILDLTGTYWLRLDDAEGHFRKDIELTLLITGVS